MNSSVSSSCLDSDFWALGHVGNSTVSNIINLQRHLTQGMNTYHVKYIYIISLVLTFIFNSEEH